MFSHDHQKAIDEGNKTKAKRRDFASFSLVVRYFVMAPYTTVTLPKPTVARRSVSQKWENRLSADVGTDFG